MSAVLGVIAAVLLFDILRRLWRRSDAALTRCQWCGRYGTLGRPWSRLERPYGVVQCRDRVHCEWRDHEQRRHHRCHRPPLRVVKGGRT